MMQKQQFWACFFLFSILIHEATLSTIDNELVGDPIVDCEDTMVALTFKTKKPFTGRVYVQGLVDDDRCSRNFASNADQSKFSMMIQNGDCTMQRQRVTGSLEGIMLSLTIVVSFHGTFVTKADRAFRCMCFFKNVQRLNNILDMSPIKTTELLDTAKMPTCSYSIHADGADGPVLNAANVGEKIFHVWQCESPEQGFLVHSCFVDDGRGMRFDLLDVDGCAIDPIIQPDVVYDPSLTRAYVETWGYKFSDTTILNYQCVVELCKKATGECDGLTPPTCGRHKRQTGNVTTQEKKRSINSGADELQLVASMEIIAEIPEKSVADLNIPTPLVSSFELPSFRKINFQRKDCIAPLMLGLIVTLIAAAIFGISAFFFVRTTIKSSTKQSVEQNT